jgi:hypothetical protein
LKHFFSRIHTMTMQSKFFEMFCKK